MTGGGCNVLTEGEGPTVHFFSGPTAAVNGPACHPLYSTFKYTQHTKDIHQCQCWAVPMIFMKKTAHFQHLKKRVTDRPSDGPSDGRTDGRIRPLIEMRGRIKKPRSSLSHFFSCHRHELKSSRDRNRIVSRN